jgi:hypothetical protein
VISHHQTLIEQTSESLMRLNNSGNLTTSMMILEKYVCRETITDELGSRALSKYRGSHWLPEIL